MNQISEEFALVLISMGKFMDQGRIYEETYRHARAVTQSSELSQLWNDMIAIAEEGPRSPLEALTVKVKLIGEWLVSISYAGTVAGVPTSWISGGKMYLEGCQMLHAAPRHSLELQGQAFRQQWETNNVRQ